GKSYVCSPSGSRLSPLCMKRRRRAALSVSPFLLLLLIVVSRASVAAVHVHDSTLHQDVEVTGQVTDASGEAIPGVTVLVKGTTIGTATDIDGQYAIAVPEEAVLVDRKSVV